MAEIPEICPCQFADRKAERAARAEFLKSSKTHVFTLIREGELPVTRRGKRFTRLLKSDLVAFVERHREQAVPSRTEKGEL